MALKLSDLEFCLSLLRDHHNLDLNYSSIDDVLSHSPDKLSKYPYFGESRESALEALSVFRRLYDATNALKKTGTVFSQLVIDTQENVPKGFTL